MVEYNLNFDMVFGALSDGTRRSILGRVLRGDLTITELAAEYALTFAGVAKHVEVLVKAQLVSKQRRGREQWVTGNDAVLRQTVALLNAYEALWSQRLQNLDQFLEEETP